MNEIEQYIRQSAIARGIDPDTAVTVARHEGGLSDPYRKGEGPAPKSQNPAFGATENSFGPFQLYISGTGSGLGDRAIASGIDPRKDWKAGVNLALDEVKNKGWGQWYGAKAAGITGFHGVNGKADPSARPDDSIQMSDAVAQPDPVAQGAANSVTPPPAGILAILAGKKDEDSGKTEGGLLNALAKLQPDKPNFIEFQGGNGSGNSPQLTDYVDQYKQSVLKKNPFQRGMTYTG